MVSVRARQACDLFEPDADIRSFFLSAYRNVQFRKMRQEGFFGVMQKSFFFFCWFGFLNFEQEVGYENYFDYDYGNNEQQEAAC